MTLGPETLASLTGEALERTAFVFVESSDAEATLEPAALATIDYAGEQAGRLAISADEGFLVELARGMLGEDESADALELGRAALCELCNIVAGSLVRALGGEHSDFRLGIPALTTPGDAPPQSGADATRCVLDSDEGRAIVDWSSSSGPVSS